jgi:uncharacterized RDD family membrane protein YckC
LTASEPTQPDHETSAGLPAAGLWRRLAAMLYDGFLVVAIWMVLGYFIQFVFGTETNQVVNGRVETDPIQDTVLFLMMVVSSFSFYAWFWTRSGQTLGMIAWRLRTQQPNGELLTFAQAVRRYLLAWPSFFLLGMGYFWLYLDGNGDALHDRFSSTRVVLLPRSHRPF